MKSLALAMEKLNSLSLEVSPIIGNTKFLESILNKDKSKDI